jgi:SAM-dependent methyltransferase
MIRIFSYLRRGPEPSQAEPAHPFDREHGVDTSGLYYADRLPSGHAHDRYSEGYYATAPSLFHGAMSLWMNSLGAGMRVEDYCFVDLGCGKGRVVLMASGYRFRAVRGIELNADLVRVARRNLRRWRRAGKAVCRDAGVDGGDVLGSEMDRTLAAGGQLSCSFSMRLGWRWWDR